MKSFKSDYNETEATIEDREERLAKELYEYLIIDPKRLELWNKIPKNRKMKNSKTTDKEAIPDFDTFKSSFKSLLILHKKCGKVCLHLQRFYQRINFDPKSIIFEEEISYPTHIIDRIMLTEEDT